MEEGRRSGNYAASIWDDDYLQSLTTPFMGKAYLGEVEQLKKKVKTIIKETDQRLPQLELINNLQRLNISYHFEHELHKLLDSIYKVIGSKENQELEDLYFTSLQFRILRQHGYHVSQDVFSKFMDDKGNFKTSLASDAKGILSLYEASFLSMEGETILDLAKDFCTSHLLKIVEKITDPILVEEIKHSLEIPLHWRVQKLEAKWFIQTSEDINPSILKLAILDFNLVQAIYQEEIKYLSRWCKETGLPEKLKFARHRLAETYFWAVGFLPNPNFGYARKIFVKTGILITIMDDIYDLYGTLDELHLLTQAIHRWDINALDSLPEYLKIHFLGLFNTVNEMAYDIMRDQGLNIISILRKLLEELSSKYNMEAKWYHSGYSPSSEEYLNYAWISISGPAVLFLAYLSITNPINNTELQYLEQYPGIIKWPCMVLRLTNDLATSAAEMIKGDVPKSIQCFMRERGWDEEQARGRVKQLIDDALKIMNKEIVMEKGKGLHKNFKECAMNLARTSLCVYHFGDGFGDPDSHTKENMVSLFVEPITMPRGNGVFNP